jgi:hypothetical protein
VTWVRLDDSMPEHPKMVGLTDRAFRQHIAALCYSNRNLTDGAIPLVIAHRLVTSGKRHAGELVTAGIWDTTNDGYQIHDYEDYQPTRAAVMRDREKTAERVARWRARNAVTPGNGNAVSNGAPNPTPTHIPKEDQSSPLRGAIDHLTIKDKTINPGTTASMERLLERLTDATQGTVGRLVGFAKLGASQADFEDARAVIAETNPRSPSRYACHVISERLHQRLEDSP